LLEIFIKNKNLYSILKSIIVVVGQEWQKIILNIDAKNLGKLLLFFNCVVKKRILANI